MLVINDLHLGVIRTAGTTPSSAVNLRVYGLQQLESILLETNEHLAINGDMFDSYSVPMTDLLQAYNLLVRWLRKGFRLTLLEGNHDVSKDNSKLSSFQFLGKILSEHASVQYIQDGAWIDEEQGVYGISHCLNQDRFDLELSKVPKAKYLLVHCNYDNHFAAQSDHSLNISEEQAKKLPVEFIVFAHEHHARIELGGKVFVCGNQWPTSVSDCLGPPKKFMTRLGEKPERIETWERDAFYKELHWKGLSEIPVAHFIRLIGTADSSEMAQVADAIALVRKSSDAFVVSNAVKVTSVDNQGQIETQSLEAARSFDVMLALKSFLTKEQYTIVEKLKNA